MAKYVKSEIEKKFEDYLDKVMPANLFNQRPWNWGVLFEEMWKGANEICAEDPNSAYLLRMDLEERLLPYGIKDDYFNKMKSGNKYALYEFPYPLGEKVFDNFDDAYNEFISNDKWYKLIYEDEGILNGIEVYERELNGKTKELGKIVCWTDR